VIHPETSTLDRPVQIQARLGADAELLEVRRAGEPQPPLADLPRRRIC
jgi:hypothetical protein